MFKSQIAKHSFLNLAGQILPMIVGLVSIPLLIKNIGLERFGILTIVWAVIGYFSLFDFGLSRVVTSKVASLRREKKPEQIPLIFWSSLRLILIFTIMGAGLLFCLSFFPDLFAGKAAPEVVMEGILCLQLMALTLPAITLTAGFKGLLEADHRFAELNKLQVLQGFLNFTLPLAVSYLTPNLGTIVISLATLRYVFFILHARLTFRLEPRLKTISLLPLRESFPLIKEGGWFSISNIIGPIMIYFDRFFLAALFPAQTLAYYTTPFEIVSRIQIIPAALTRTLFPTFAKNRIGPETYRIYRRAVILMSALMGSIALIGVPLARPAIGFWISKDFAEQSSFILALLLIGFSINSIAWIPFTLLQSLGRPDLTAKLHLAEVPFYCALLYFLTTKFGLPGAAISWGIRSLVDLFVLLFLSRKILSERQN